MATTTEIYQEFAQSGARPDPLLSVSEWADRFRMLSSKASAEPGRWRTDRTPYLREIMDCLSSDSPYEEVVFMKGAQIGGTEVGNNWLGYIIHQAPGPMLMVQPTIDMAKRNSKQRIDPLIEESDVLRALVSDARSRDSGNSMLMKEFPGGVLVMTGANSPASLRAMPARYIFFDEADAYPGDVGGEGDPIELGIARSRTFSRSKRFLPSTPKVSGSSRIEARYEQSDKRQYWVPCPHCEQLQVLMFPRLVWEKGKPATVGYRCEHCAELIRNHQKQQMLARGEWRASAPGNGRIAGFHLSSLYSPVGWMSWAQIVEQFEKAQNDQTLLQVFVNTVLGETWSERGEVPDWRRLYDRREAYRVRSVPQGALFLTAGIDVQKDRIEAEVVGWGRDRQSWSVNFEIIEGSTSAPQTWEMLTEFLGRYYKHASGTMLPIAKVAVDSGYATSDVYQWYRKSRDNRVVVIKGDTRQPAPVSQATKIDIDTHGKRVKNGLRVWPINSNMLKEELYRWLRLDGPTNESAPYPAGYCHFPQYSEEFFKQLTAEQLVTKIVKGYRHSEWQKTRDRNEALDCRVYARAAAAIYGLDRSREHDWDELERRLAQQKVDSVAPKPPEPLPAPVAAPATPTPRAEPPKSVARQVIRSKWMDRGR